MMNWKKKCVKQKLDDRGSAMVMVIVVVAFITILATTLLYVAGANYFRKITDLKTKESFYEAETALEEIRAALMVEVSAAAKEAYTTVTINYAAADSTTRAYLFQNEFLDALAANWKDKTNSFDADADSNVYELVLQSLVSDPYKMAITLSIEGNPLYTGDNHAELKGVELQYTDAQGYTTMISTDFWIAVPSFNWSVDLGVTGNEVWDDGSERYTVDMTNFVTYHNYIKK